MGEALLRRGLQKAGRASSECCKIMIVQIFNVEKPPKRNRIKAETAVDLRSSADVNLKELDVLWNRKKSLSNAPSATTTE